MPSSRTVSLAQNIYALRDDCADALRGGVFVLCPDEVEKLLPHGGGKADILGPDGIMVVYHAAQYRLKAAEYHGVNAVAAGLRQLVVEAVYEIRQIRPRLREPVDDILHFTQRAVKNVRAGASCTRSLEPQTRVHHVVEERTVKLQRIRAHQCLERLGRRVLAEIIHDRAVTRHDRHKSLQLQPHDRLMDGGTRYAEVFGHLSLGGKAGPGSQLAREYPAQKLLPNGVGY